MPIRPSVKSIEGNLLYIDEGGNLVLDTIGKINGQIQSGVIPQFLVRGGPTPSDGGLLSSGGISLSSAQLLNLGSAVDGAIINTTINQAGTGYASGNTCRINSAGNAQARLTIDTVGGSGEVLTYTFTNPGAGYSVATVFPADVIGTGTGLSLDVTAISTIGAIEIVAAPGADEAIVPVQAISTLTFGTIAYPVISDGFSIGGLDAKLAPFNTGSNDADSYVNQTFYATIGAPKEGTAGVAVNLEYSGDPLAVGPIVTTTLADGGSGYEAGDSGIVDGGDAGFYTVDTVDGGGAVLTYTITAPGTGYSVANDVATLVSTGVGTDFTINITDVAIGDGTGTIEVFYRIVTWP